MPLISSRCRLFFLLALLIGFPAAAEEVDIENAPTPTRLIDLLPEGGIDAVNVDVWTVTKATHRNGLSAPSDTYTHCSIRPVGGKLVFELRQYQPMPKQTLMLQRLVYSPAGKLEDYREILEGKDTRYVDMVGKIEGKNLVIEPHSKTGIVDPVFSQTANRSIPMKAFEDCVPSAWIPLVRAYHIRAGHLGYRYATIDLKYNSKKLERSVEDVGAEVLQAEGREVTGHLLIEQGHSGQNGLDRKTSEQVIALQNGSVFSSKTSRGDYSYTTRRVSAEEAREKLGLDE